MFVTEFLIAIVIALLVTVIFAYGLSWNGPWPSFWWFFLVILLASWAFGLWARPFGPAVFGVFWAPFLAFGLVVALLLAAAAPPDRRGPPRAPDLPSEHDEDVAAGGAVVALGVFFWIVVLVLLSAVVVGYL